MQEILIKAGCFIGTILLGIILRKVGYFKKEDFKVLSKVVLKITLTGAIINSFTGRSLEYSMLLLSLVGLGFGVLLITMSVQLFRKSGKERQAFAVINSSGCNIGNFAMPFAQGFLGPVGVMAISIFDMGNSFICLGGSFSTASMIKNGNGKFQIKPMLKAFSKSVPLITYIIMTIFAILHFSLPVPITRFAEMAANANGFMAMLMIGVGFQISGNKSQIKDIAKLLIMRYSVAITLALLVWFYAPFDIAYKQALVIAFFAPIASAAPPFTAELGGDFGLASAVNSFSIIVSIILITGSLFVIL